MKNRKNNNPQEINQAEIDFLRDMKTLRMNLPGIDKNLKGYGYKYQNFNEIAREIKKVIDKHNLCLDFKQFPTFTVVGEQQVLHVVRTTFYSTNTGYKDSFDTPILTENLKWNNENGSKNIVNTVPQLVGSSITYFKRYALVAYLNIESEVDTDAAPIYNNHENENSMPSKQAGVNQNQVKNFDKKLKTGKYYCYELFRIALFNIKNWVNDEKEKNNINALIRALCFENEADLDEIFNDNPGFKSIQYWANILLEYFKKTNKLDELNKFEDFITNNHDVYETSVLKFFCMLKKERQFDYIFAV
ncbi:ERF family protein [Borreliella burgdorferi]|uniref:ERF family protein n=1 Tax=Borreliella burgdorferi TaxID=139 RepID=UPI000D0257E3|nr:ERF family protein [Borreliella burgdorferi]PRR38353.1 single-stranded DNA-binding protein [Borreliella burgdorferi]